MKDELYKIHNRHRKKIVVIDLIENILIDWLEISLSSNEFIIKRDFNLKKKTDERLLAVKQKIALLSSKLGKEEVKNIDRYCKEFPDIFSQAIQANRIYLSLVNVVMAGAALEFTTISKALRKETLNQLNNLLKSGQRDFAIRFQRSILLVILTLSFIILIASYYHYNLAHGIRDISKTFENFVEGNLEVNIPGMERNDEIGQLAKAADAFKKVSIKMKEEQDRAERLTKSKSEFLANMSHEIRTPMNGILGMVTLLKKAGLNEEQVEMLETIDSCGDSLLTILNDVLDFSKIEAGKMDIDPHPFNLKKCVDEVSFLFKERATSKNLTYSCEIKGDIPDCKLEGDSVRIKQIVINLLSNAFKFTEKGSIQFVTTAKKQENDTYKIKFEVIDTGVGISSESLENLFSAFTQADASITRKFGGTGLGLSISKNLANMMNAHLYAESKLYEGSTFIFEIDLKKSIEIDKIETHISPIQGDLSLKILVVEDNDVNIKIVTLFLQKMGIQCKVAKNGHEAIRQIENESFDLIFMDMQMPIMDGVTATIEIRKKFDKEALPIIAMTANAFEDDKKKCFAAGMNNFISKPISFNDLKEIIFEYSSKNKAAS